MLLTKKKKYLQVALNSTMQDAVAIISQLPPSDRIIIEAGTPLIKRYGIGVVYQLKQMWQMRVAPQGYYPYVVADLKTMDRGSTEVSMAAASGASAVIGLGQAPVETINSFVESCRKYRVDSMLDMMNIEHSIKTLRQLKQLPDVVLLHRGVDEEAFNKHKPIPYLQINKIRASYDVLISIAGGDTVREVQRAIFNDANIVVVWKEFYQTHSNTAKLAADFLREIK